MILAERWGQPHAAWTKAALMLTLMQISSAALTPEQVLRAPSESMVWALTHPRGLQGLKIEEGA